MGRLVEAEENLLHYLQSLNANNSDTYTVGLISGQPAQTKDLIIHLARTPETKITNDDFNNSESIKSSAVSHKKKSFTNSLSLISDSWMANHALYMTRMLPGGMYVLGIFVVSSESLFDNNVQMLKVRSMLNQIYKVLRENKYLHALPDQKACSEILVLHFNTSSNKHICKGIKVDKEFKLDSILTNVDWKFIPPHQNNNWFQLDCCYELDDIFPLKTNNNEVSIKCQYESILEFISKVVWSATMFVDGEVKDSEMTLESILQQKVMNHNKNNDETTNNTKGFSSNYSADMLEQNLSISMFVPSDNSSYSSGKCLGEEEIVVKLPGTVSFSGIISSSVWMHHSCRLLDAHNAIRSDILRSLQARIQICCDSLDTDTVEGRVTISEPPRRVLIPLQSKVCFSDYLFNGETASEAVLSAREVLDLHIEEDKIIADIEYPAEISSENKLLLKQNIRSEESLLENSHNNQAQRDTNTIMIVSGIVISLVVLLISLFVNFYYNL